MGGGIELSLLFCLHFAISVSINLFSTMLHAVEIMACGSLCH